MRPGRGPVSTATVGGAIRTAGSVRTRLGTRRRAGPGKPNAMDAVTSDRDRTSDTRSTTVAGVDPTDPGVPPFRAHVLALLDAVRDHDLATLQALCDDTLGIVDAGPDLQPVVVDDPAGHTAWFEGLFAQLDAIGARTWSELTDLRSERLADRAAHSVVRFTQYLVVGEATAEVDALATVVWKRTDDGRWVEARWHASVLEARLPEGFPGN